MVNVTHNERYCKVPRIEGSPTDEIREEINKGLFKMTHTWTEIVLSSI